MPNIGKEMLELRKRRRLNIRDLSARSGVSHSTISLIERDRISPSIDTLQAILDALGSTMVEFFNRASASSESPIYRAEDLPEIGNVSAISYKIIGLNHPRRAMQFLKETYQPGTDTGRHLTHAAQEAGLVISGEIELELGDKVETLHPGDGYYFDSSTEHRFRNAGSETAEIVSAVCPPSY